jgi:hypothetical protein
VVVVIVVVVTAIKKNKSQKKHNEPAEQVRILMRTSSPFWPDVPRDFLHVRSLRRRPNESS